MSGLAKGLAVLEAFGGGTPKLSISDVAGRTGFNRAVVRRCLLTFVELGYLAYDGKYFTPTPRVLRLADIYAESDSLAQLARPHLAAAREQLQESVSIAVLQNDEALFVARSEVMRIVNTGVRVGASVPAYTSATGHILLAGLTETELEAYLDRCRPQARTPKTPTRRSDIRARVDQARTEDLALTDEELAAGLRSLAVPVRNSHGHTVAAMSVSATADRITITDLRDRFLPILRNHAEQLGRTL